MTGGFWFEALGPKKTRVINVATIDPHMPIPAWVLNWLLGNVAYLILPMLYRMSKNFAPGGRLESCVSGNPQVYGEIKRRLEALEARTRLEAAAGSESAAASVAAAEARRRMPTPVGGDGPAEATGAGAALAVSMLVALLAATWAAQAGWLRAAGLWAGGGIGASSLVFKRGGGSSRGGAPLSAPLVLGGLYLALQATALYVKRR